MCHTYLYIATFSPIHPFVSVWRHGQWLIPNLSAADVWAVQEEMPRGVQYVGIASEIENHPDLPDKIMIDRWGGQIFALTDKAYLAATQRWEARAKLGPPAASADAAARPC